MRDLDRNDACLRALQASVKSDHARFHGGGTMSTKRLPQSDRTCGGSRVRPSRVPSGTQIVCEASTPASAWQTAKCS